MLTSLHLLWLVNSVHGYNFDTCTHITQEVKNIFRVIDSIFSLYNAGTINYSETRDELLICKSIAINLNSSGEQLLACTSIGVALSSLDYWHQYADDWDQNTGNASEMSTNDKRVLNADWRSAAIGLIPTAASGGSFLYAAYAGGCISSIVEGYAIGFGWW